MRAAYCNECRADAGAGTEAQCGVGVLDRDVGLARPQLEEAADGPAAREARVERQGTIDQRHHGADVLAKIGEREGGIRKDACIVTGFPQGPPCEIDALLRVRPPTLAPIVKRQSSTAERGVGECGAVTRITGDRLLYETERLSDLPFRPQDHRIGAEIEVV